MGLPPLEMRQMRVKDDWFTKGLKRGVKCSNWTI